MQADEVDSKGVELGQGGDKLAQAAGEAVISIIQNSIEPAPLGVGEESIERWTGSNANGWNGGSSRLC